MKGHGTKFNSKKEAAVAALLTQKNQEEAARAVGISVATLLRWQKLPEFQKAYREASTLLRVMVDPNTPASTKVRAADSVLEHSAKSIELEDIDARVAELERAVDLPKPSLKE